MLNARSLILALALVCTGVQAGSIRVVLDGDALLDLPIGADFFVLPDGTQLLRDQLVRACSPFQGRARLVYRPELRQCQPLGPGPVPALLGLDDPQLPVVVVQTELRYRCQPGRCAVLVPQAPPARSDPLFQDRFEP